VDFFGTPAATVRGPGLLAARTDAEVLTALVRRLDGPRARYHLAIRPLEFATTGDPGGDLHSLTRAYHAALEAAIRESPEQYFWFHKRWKTRPEEEEPGHGGAVPLGPEEARTRRSGPESRTAEDLS
jgi:KDO2-lipid IV(A) lauroyltransferase